MNSSLIEAMRQIVSADNLLINEPMSRHTTFRTGGPACLFLRPENQDQLKKVMDFVRRLGTDYFVLGNGSNLLVSDEGYDGVIISLSKFNKVELKGSNQIYVEAGAMNSGIASFARDNALTGFEFAAGIPGTIGGAMIMNAGAYGGEMAQVVTEVTVLSPEGEIMVLDNSTMEFGYRTSAIKNKGFIVLSVLLTLKRGKEEEITAQMKELAEKRRDKQPLEYPSAGSTFKRPEGYFAGKLIEDAGLRGFSVGDAQVSEKHCGFVVNKGSATSTDIYNLIKEVQKVVYEKANVRLEPEVIILGKFS
ncbi:UDP-N-acetylmuramate dehydrogenase [Butyrivibrio hungatei DSM 14810]|uniref:UDP-N-acetylenolpyruvoylglucosamine reductase n=1 Tax=Butyrivibrio hungatei DSM 14810 TaxID=1121132 RepID=A0A1M7T4G6_9FIRM|nr:UDP-N-acetylmuramate dehydrogenase [Butyrivibrio hungatei]SHN65643.1 UDP-N-acetylmuramate dehydrogenase [Butyrivibrio hungatei DSM 14810]